MFLNGTSKRLSEFLLVFVGLSEFHQVPYRKNLQFLADNLIWEGWVAMSLEEIIVRNHFDFLGVTGQPKARTTELYKHEKLLMMLGRVGNHPKLSRPRVQEVVKRLVEVKILLTDKYGSGEDDYNATRLANPQLTIDQAAHEVRTKINENRA
jgi:hypothetical protein